MSQRLLDLTKWLWCLLALQSGSLWGPVRSITVRTPPKNPSTIEAQAKFFQDFFSVQLSPYKIEFGHVCEDPNTWEQRYEKKDYKNHRDMGKVRWGDKKGGYGEHYWDLNHAGHANEHGDDGDDGSYHESNDPYDEPSNYSPSYGNEEYDPENSSYEESNRAKRAHPKIKVERKRQRITQPQEEEEAKPAKRNKSTEKLQTAATNQDEQYEDSEEIKDEYEEPQRKRHQYRKKEQEQEEEEYEEPQPKRHQYRKKEEDEEYEEPQPKRHQYRKKEEDEEYEEAQPKRHQYRKKEETTTQQPPKEKNKLVLVVTHKDDAEPPTQQAQPTSQYVAKQPDYQQYVPYEGGAGVRQHQQPEVSAASHVPRLFLEPSTGHVVDRATGQAYVLQPIINTYN